MAFLGQDDEFAKSDFVTEIQDKMAKITNVAIHRDEIIAANEETPMKIAIAAGIGMWGIYHFLIKR